MAENPLIAAMLRARAMQYNPKMPSFEPQTPAPEFTGERMGPFPRDQMPGNQRFPYQGFVDRDGSGSGTDINTTGLQMQRARELAPAWQTAVGDVLAAPMGLVDGLTLGRLGDETITFDAARRMGPYGYRVGQYGPAAFLAAVGALDAARGDRNGVGIFPLAGGVAAANMAREPWAQSLMNAAYRDPYGVPLDRAFNKKVVGE